MIERANASADNLGSEVFVLRDEAFPGPKNGGDKKTQFVQANYMKVAEANSGNYAKMESEIFKPMHQAKAKAGHMNDWVLAQRILPYGSDWDNNFMTFDIYADWSDMTASNSGMFEKVHPGKDAGGPNG